MVESLRSRLVAADLAWSRLPLPDGSVSSVPRTGEQAAGMAVLVVYGWLSDMVEGLSWLPVDPYAVEDQGEIARRVLRVQLDDLKGAAG